MKKISVIAQIIQLVEGERARADTTCYYPEKESDIPENCFFGERANRHYWITENGVPPPDTKRCLCGIFRYGRLR